ncbi:MAG TPA: DNA polymerase [Terracidiphilus sp.]|nr:DNA polymerase [Terracidiphilus sp.]
MPPDHFISFFADPFSSAEPLFAVSARDGHPSRMVGLPQLLDEPGLAITFQADRLVEGLRIRDLKAPKLVDIRHALQLASGLPRREFDQSDWRVSKWLRLTRLSPVEQELYFGLLDGTKARPDQRELERLLLRVSEATADVWDGVSAELERIGELERFLKIEIPVQQLMYERQMKGLAVDLPRSQAFLIEAKSQKYKAMLNVGAALQHNPTGVTYRNVLPLIVRTDASCLADFSGSRNLESYFKMAANKSQFARDFRAMINANRNIKFLLSFTTSGGRIFPAFDAMGTVTARIQASSPNVQQLRRSFRGALSADPGMHCAYLDFAQYEPGVLAQFVGPGRYRELYNAGDVYASLSNAVFGNASKRDLSKQVFIAFCYGMELESIARLLEGSRHSEMPSGYARSVSDFFEQFPELTGFKRKCEADLRQSGFVTTMLGNRRVRRHSGGLTRKERGWAMNQVIQGTASLIFKDVLLSLARILGSNSILLPIHDAVWLQAPKDSMTAEEFQTVAANEMGSVFRKWCPDIAIRVKVSAFDES